MIFFPLFQQVLPESWSKSVGLHIKHDLDEDDEDGQEDLYIKAEEGRSTLSEGVRFFAYVASRREARILLRFCPAI